MGLGKNEAAIYLALLKSGPLTLLQISRDTQINRTSAYRICEQLEKKGFIYKDAECRTTKYEAASLDFLQTKIKDLQDQAELAKEKYNSFYRSFENWSKSTKKPIRVIHYTGRDEVRQMVWNSLKAKTIIKSFAYRTISEPLGRLFVVRWWNEYVKSGISSQLIANPGTFELKNAVDKHTKEKYLKPLNSRWQKRIVDPKILKITQETFIYDDVFAILQWDKKNVFGVEIYNQAVTDQQTAVFNVLWKMAGRVK